MDNTRYENNIMVGARAVDDCLDRCHFLPLLRDKRDARREDAYKVLHEARWTKAAP